MFAYINQRPDDRLARRLEQGLLILVLLFVAGLTRYPTTMLTTPPITISAPDFGRQSLAFVPNTGQAAPEVQFQARGMGGTISFTPAEVVLALPASHERQKADADVSAVHLRFEGAAPNPTLRGVEQLSGVVNYLLGSNPAQWHTDIPTYAGIVYQRLYPGTDLRYDGHDGALKGTYTIAPGADPSQIRWRYDGAVSLDVDQATGDLRIALPDAQTALIEKAPVAWQTISGRRVPVAVRYTRDNASLVGFALGTYDPAYPLVIDPSLEYSTYLGGNRDDVGRGIAVDSAGNVYITGTTFSSTFPVAGAFQPLPAGKYAWSDAFITKLTPTSKLIYSTYFGGSDDEEALSIAVDQAGSAYITGLTFSDPFDPTSFPLVNAVQPIRGEGQGVPSTADAFVTKFSPAGNGIVYSTYLGGNNYDYGRSIAVDGSGNAYITGNTRSTDFPRVHALQTIFNGGEPTYWDSDAFVTKLNAAGSAFVYSTYLGGAGDDRGNGIALDSAGNAYITGITESLNFPLKNPFQGTVVGDAAAFVTKIGPDGAALIYSTYLGGNDSDGGNAIAVDSAGSAYVTGETHSYTFPVAHPIQPRAPGGLDDAFVSKLKPDGSGLVYGTHLGGRSAEIGYGIAVDNEGSAYVTGTSASDDFPTSNPIQTNNAIHYQAFVIRLNAAGTALSFSTQLGGDSYDYGYAIAVDAAENAFTTGETSSLTFPTFEAVQKHKGNPDPSDKDGFVAKIDTSCYGHGPIVYGMGGWISPCRGGSLGGDFTNDRLVIDFLKEAVVMDVQVGYDPSGSGAVQLTGDRHPVFRFTLSATDSTGHAVTQFLKPYTLMLTYTDAELAAAGVTGESSLNIAFYNPETNAWVNMLPCAGCGVDTEHNRITIVADHFTEFALFSKPSEIYLPFMMR